MTHTPTPWKVDPSFLGDIQADGTEIASCFNAGQVGDEWEVRGPITVSYAQSLANAALIVRAVNNHDALVELAHQYASDLRHPPTADSRERRLERIAAVLAKAGAA